MKFEELQGKKITKIEGLEKDSERVVFADDDGNEYLMHHVQDCCENVSVEDVIGDVNDLIGEELLLAAETSSSNDHYNESSTWTFYHLATRKGHVTIRWYGNSNGYYSESVTFDKLN